MNHPTTTTGPTDPALLAQLPEAATGPGEDGYDFLANLDPCWQPVPHWGHGGWCLGAWPHMIVCHYTNPARRLFGVLAYVEGDLDVRAYRSRHERDTDTDATAAACWRAGTTDDRPADLPPAGAPPHPAHRGPHRSLRRAVIYTQAPTARQAVPLLHRGRARAAYWHYSIVGEYTDHGPDDPAQLAHALAAVTTGAATILLTPALTALAASGATAADVVAALRDRGGRVETFADQPDPRHST